MNSQIESLMNFCYENGAFNGAILVAKSGEIIYQNAFGYANFETGEPLKTKTSFYLASVSKQFTAMGVLMLKSQNKLSLDDKLSFYFPELPSFANLITIKHLLTHTSGLPDYYKMGIYKPGLTNNDVLSTLVKQPSLEFIPGEKYAYSNSGYVLLSMIIEKVSGIPFRLFMQNYIFNPLEMNSTVVFDETKPEIQNQATGFNILGELDDYDASTTGGGGIFSTTEDLFKWNQALYSGKLVPDNLLKEAYAPFTLNDGSISDYGYGWRIKDFGYGKAVFHSGSLAGFRTYIFRDLNKRHFFVILTNNGEANAINEICEALRHFLYEGKYASPRLPVSLKLYKLSETNRIESVIEDYYRLKKDHYNKYYFSRNQLNSLGYLLLAKGRDDEALEVFKLNLKEHHSLTNPKN